MEGCDLASLPDDVFALVVAAVDQPQAAARLLATCRRVRAAVPAPPGAPPGDSPGELGPSAPMVVQVQATSACLAAPASAGEFGAARLGGLELAAACGWVHLLPRLVEQGELWGDEASWQAVRHNRLQVVQWERLHVPSALCGPTCNDAAENGRLEVLQWARAQSPPAPWNETICEAAARGGHLELLRWARAQSPPVPWSELTSSIATGYGHLELVEWADAHAPPPPWDVTPEGSESSQSLEAGGLEDV